MPPRILRDGIFFLKSQPSFSAGCLRHPHPWRSPRKVSPGTWRPFRPFRSREPFVPGSLFPVRPGSSRQDHPPPGTPFPPRKAPGTRSASRTVPLRGPAGAAAAGGAGEKSPTRPASGSEHQRQQEKHTHKKRETHHTPKENPDDGRFSGSRKETMIPPGKMLFPPKEDSPLQESTPSGKLRGRPSGVHRKTSVTFPVFLRSELRSDAVLPFFPPGNPDATPASGIPFQRPPSGTDRDPEKLPVPEGMQEPPGRDGLHGRRTGPTANGS